ncbi:endonuclease/exonuclease/phosphatase family protein [uncultured Alistipes sp.]|jgi:metal-dependent hydrolase|uniref:endonuclease/exonuclease/phosphatase family protein n=1 Tax=uncultured Alistipes sp. TaxID=538949 RepID=UPI0025DCF149|nr:endonuclease/exonuclease/phosphatase family protein [uncultured Alistipes sp.]
MKKLKFLLCGITLCALACSSSKDDGGGGSGSSNTLKVMSFNVRYNAAGDTGDTNWDMRKTACVKMINKVRPDVIGMQEPRTVQRTYLKDNLMDYEMLEVPNTGTGAGGNSVLLYNTTRFAKIDWGYYFLSATPDVPSTPWGVSEQWHTTVWAHLKEIGTDKEFWFFTTHMPAYDTGQLGRVNGALLNVAKMKEIAGENAKVAIAGDMNCSYATDDIKREALTPYYQWMLAGRALAPTGDAYSFNNYGVGTATAKRNLDHVFYRNMTMGMSFRTLTDNYGVTYISDHYPVLLSVLF